MQVFTLNAQNAHLNCYVVLDFMPLYYQACKGASPVKSGVDFFGLAMVIGPSLILTGASIAITKRYRPQLWLAWALCMIGVGIMSTLRADSSLAKGVGYLAILGVGGGILFAGTYFPVLAPLPVTENAHALAFFAFCRYFAGVSYWPPCHCLAVY